MEQVTLDEERIIQIVGASSEQALKWTAADIRNKSRSSMKVANQTSTNKRTGKTRTLRGSHSAPGQAPYRRKGSIYNLLLYIIGADKKSAIIGPRNLSGHAEYANSVPGILERGGNIEIKTREYLPTKKRKFSLDSERNTHVNKYGERRSARPDRVNQTYEKRYRYFFSEQRWNWASEAPMFQLWARNKRYVENRKKAHVEKRPFMVPAMERVLTEENLASKVKRALAKAK